MRTLLVLAMLPLLAACTQAAATRLDARTFRIDGPGIAGGSAAPNRRLARQLCPGGYRLLSQEQRRHTPDDASDEPGTFTNWTIRCI